MSVKLTEADLLKCTTHEAAHFHGKGLFGYVHRCNQHPRLTRIDRYTRANRSVQSTWRVDGADVASLAEAAEKLSVPPQVTIEQIMLLKLVPDEWIRFEDRGRFHKLTELGLIEFKDGDCRRTDLGRAILAKEMTA